MHVPIPPLITSDSHNSSFKNDDLFYPYSSMNLPIYESTSDVVNPVPGMLIYLSLDQRLAFYDGTTWQILVQPPYQQVGNKLVGTGYSTSGGIFPYQGTSTALSGDGNTLAIGGNNDNEFIGATWIFIRSGGVWTQQGAKLVGTGASGTAQQGTSVALSADGNTLAVGGYADNSNVGAIWIFTRTAGVWSQQGSKLVATGSVGSSRVGYVVDLSADGNTLVTGGYSDNSNAGATWVFTRSAGVWTQQGSKLIGTGAIGNSRQGSDVSISEDTIVTGGSADNSGAGAIWIFTRTAGVWSQQGSKLVGTGAVGNASQGYSVSIKGDTVVSGGYGDNSLIGATWVFKRTAGVWTQQGSKLVGTGYVGTDIEQGSSVSISLDEKTLITTGGNDNSGIGAVWVFKLSGGVWTQFNNKLVGTGYVGIPYMGYIATESSISDDGSIFSLGGPGDNGNIGATWIFSQ